MAPIASASAPRRLTPIWTLKAAQFLGTAAFACIVKYLPVYYASIGLDRNIIGILQFAGMGTTFVGQIFWSAVIDRLGEYKTVLVGTQLVGTILLFGYTLPLVQNSVPLVFIVAISNQFLTSTGGSIIDAMCMSVLAEYKKKVCPTSTPRTAAGAQVTYGDTRLYSALGWGGMSLVMGQLIDSFGLNAMFAGFAIIQFTNVTIVVMSMPSPNKEEQAAQAAEQAGQEPAPGILSLLKNFHVFWSFANLFIYGIGTCLIENFLFVYLVQEFDNATNFILGASVTVMCIFEIPVFKWVGPWLEKQPAGSQKAITITLVLCQLIQALRCWLYAIMPRDMAWLVLVIGALQGVTFAAMWVAAMEYAKRLSNEKTLATMASLTNGVYYQISMAVGALIWGQVVEPSPKGVGFRHSFLLDAIALIIWSIIWQLGLFCLSKSKVNTEEGARALAH